LRSLTKLRSDAAGELGQAEEGHEPSYRARGVAMKDADDLAR